MLLQVVHLLWRSVVGFPTVLSASWWSILLPLLVFAIKNRRNLRDWSPAMRLQLWADAKVLICVYAALFCVAIVRSVHDDHEYLKANIRDKNHVIEKLMEDDKPSLSGEIQLVMTAPAGDNNENTLLTIVATIKALHSPSIATDYAISYRLPTGKEVDGTIIPRPIVGHDLTLFMAGGGDHLRFPREDWLLHKTGELPIPLNGAAEGFIQAVIPGVSADQRSRCIVVLRFRDVQGKQYTVEKARGDTSKSSLQDFSHLQRGMKRLE